MAQLDPIIAQIAAALSITSFDVYVFFGALVIAGIIMAMGLVRIYNIFIGAVLGVGIFVLFSTILAPELQTPETLSLISDAFAKILIGSSVYLIFILAILVPLNGGITVTLPKNVFGKILQTLGVTLVLILFLLAIFIGLVDKSYIFVHTDSAFTLIKKLGFYSDIQGSLLFSFVASHIPTIIILSIGYIIYKILFADIVNAMVLSLIKSLKKAKASEEKKHDGGGGDD